MRNVISRLLPSIQFEAVKAGQAMSNLRYLRLSPGFAHQRRQSLEDPGAAHLLGDAMEQALMALDEQVRSNSREFAVGVIAGSFPFSFCTGPVPGEEAAAVAGFDKSGCLASLSIRNKDSGWRFQMDGADAHFLLDRYRGESMRFRRCCAELSLDPDLSPFKRESFNAALARLRKTAPVRCRMSGGVLVHDFHFLHCFELDPSVDGSCYDLVCKALLDRDLRLQSLSISVAGTSWSAQLGE